MKQNTLQREIELPSQVEANIEGNLLKIKGPKGTNERILKAAGINFEIKDQKISLSSLKDSRNEKRMLNTFFAHINNMIIGSQRGFVYKLKICSGHFPMKVTVEDKTVVINNFLGEKIPRKAKIYENVKVEIVNDIITVLGTDKEKTAQTASNIETATRIRKRDRRVFQDGIYITSKAENE